jgi:hypothetical protein
MDNIKTIQHNLATIGWGALLVWWGLSFMIGPITIGMSAVGTGLILLGVNAARALKGISASRSTTAWGIIALGWGILDHALALSFERSFAALLIVIGVVTLMSLLARPKVNQVGAL